MTNGIAYCLQTVKGSKVDFVNPEKIFAATLDIPMKMLVQCSLTIKTKPTNQTTKQTQIPKKHWGRKTEHGTFTQQNIY